MKSRRKPPPEEDFQMAPMIDMVFLLLVFFMTVGTMAKDARPPLELAESSQATPAEPPAPPEVLSLHVNADDVLQLQWGLQPMPVENASARIREVVKKEPGTVFLLRIERNLTYARLQPLLRACAEAGAVHLEFSVFNQS